MKLINILPKNKQIVFACIGTDRSTGDSLGPLVGMMLEKEGFNVVGTLEDPMHALSMEEKREFIKEKYPKHFVVAIDACLGNSRNIGEIIYQRGGLKPGAAVGKDIPAVGDASIKAIVNIGGFMEHNVLQSTRLSLVYKMAEEIVSEIKEFSLKCQKKNVYKSNYYGYNKYVNKIKKLFKPEKVKMEVI